MAAPYLAHIAVMDAMRALPASATVQEQACRALSNLGNSGLCGSTPWATRKVGR